MTDYFYLDIYVGGNFLLSIKQDDGNLAHVGSLALYNPDEDTYADAFDGGVFRKVGQLNLLVETPLLATIFIFILISSTVSYFFF